VRVVPLTATDRAAPVGESMLMNIMPIFLDEGRQA
jgi:hypothetical protein